MPTPQILADIARLLIQLLPAMALVCLVLAGIALRLEGGSTFLIGGGFTKWIFWGIIMLTLPRLLLWFSFFGLPVPSTAGPIGTSWLAGIQNGVSTFVNSFIIGRLTIVVAAYFVVRAVLDATHGDRSAGVCPHGDVFSRDTDDSHSDIEPADRDAVLQQSMFWTGFGTILPGESCRQRQASPSLDRFSIS